MSCVRCQVLSVGFQVSGFMCYVSFLFFPDKVVELVCWGSVLTGPTPSSFIVSGGNVTARSLQPGHILHGSCKVMYKTHGLRREG